MSNRTYITITTPNVYGEGESTERLEVKKPGDVTTCCATVASSSFIYAGPRCDKKAKATYQVEARTVDTNHRGVSTEETITVGFCGTHDPVKKATRKRNKRIKELAQHQREQETKERVKQTHEAMVEEINALAGETIVRVGYNRDYRHTTVELVAPAKLQSLLEGLVK